MERKRIFIALTERIWWEKSTTTATGFLQRTIRIFIEFTACGILIEVEIRNEQKISSGSNQETIYVSHWFSTTIVSVLLIDNRKTVTWEMIIYAEYLPCWAIEYHSNIIRYSSNSLVFNRLFDSYANRLLLAGGFISYKMLFDDDDISNLIEFDFQVKILFLKISLPYLWLKNICRQQIPLHHSALHLL